MKENNINQVAMDIEENEVVEVTERKGIITRAKEKVQDFGEKHPTIVKIGKAAVGIVLIGGAFVAGKAYATSETEKTDEEVEFEALPVVDVALIETTEE